MLTKWDPVALDLSLDRIARARSRHLPWCVLKKVRHWGGLSARVHNRLTSINFHPSVDTGRVLKCITHHLYFLEFSMFQRVHCKHLPYCLVPSLCRLKHSMMVPHILLDAMSTFK